MSERVWTPEMIDALKRLRGRGRTFGQIAKMLGVSRSAAIGKAMRVGLRVRARVKAARAAAMGAAGEILERGVCHWIAGDIEAAWRMCGHKSVHGTLWCAHHLARVYENLAAPAPERKEAGHEHKT